MYGTGTGFVFIWALRRLILAIFLQNDLISVLLRIEQMGMIVIITVNSRADNFYIFFYQITQKPQTVRKSPLMAQWPPKWFPLMAVDLSFFQHSIALFPCSFCLLSGLCILKRIILAVYEPTVLIVLFQKEKMFILFFDWFDWGN